MPSSPKSKIAFAHFQQAFAVHRLPHAVLVNGAPRGAGGDFAEQLLSLPFQETNPARLRAHVDIRWIEPGMAVTMDYRHDRLNANLSGNGRINSFNCG